MSQYPTMKVTDEFVAKIRQRATAALALSATSPTANQGADVSQWCGSMFNQLQEGSCTECTDRNYTLWLENKYGYNPVIEPDVQVGYYFARELFGDVNSDGGSTVHDAFQGSVQYGIIPASVEPYNESTLYTKPDLSKIAFKATAVKDYTANTASIRSILDSGIPAGVAVMVDQQLFNPVDTPTGLTDIVSVYQQVPNEGHAVLIVAYKTDPTYGYLYRFQNSWGTSYGDNGFAWFTEAYLEKYLFEVCTLDIPKTLTPPAPNPQPKPEVYQMLETDLVEHHQGVIVNDDTYVPPDLWERAGVATQVDATHFMVNGKTYPGAIQNGTTYIHYQVMKDAGYTLTKINPLGWTCTK